LSVLWTTQVDQRSCALLLEGEQQLLEPGGLGPHGGGFAVGVRRARPECERLLARGQPFLGGGGRQRLLGERLEPPDVDVVHLGDE
jgi:hypothetical protein